MIEKIELTEKIKEKAEELNSPNLKILVFLGDKINEIIEELNSQREVLNWLVEVIDKNEEEKMS